MITKQAVVHFNYKTTGTRKKTKCIMMVEFMHDQCDTENSLAITRGQKSRLQDELEYKGYIDAKIKKVAILHMVHQDMRITEMRPIATKTLDPPGVKHKKAKKK